MVSSDDVTITEPTDDRLRDIARKATGTGYYSGGVKALRAVWNAARAAERMPEDVQKLVDEADHLLSYSRADMGVRVLIGQLAAALKATYSQKGSRR